MYVRVLVSEQYNCGIHMCFRTVHRRTFYLSFVASCVAARLRHLYVCLFIIINFNLNSGGSMFASVSLSVFLWLRVNMSLFACPNVASRAPRLVIDARINMYQNQSYIYVESMDEIMLRAAVPSSCRVHRVHIYRKCNELFQFMAHGGTLGCDVCICVLYVFAGGLVHSLHTEQHAARHLATQSSGT